MPRPSSEKSSIGRPHLATLGVLCREQMRMNRKERTMRLFPMTLTAAVGIALLVSAIPAKADPRRRDEWREHQWRREPERHLHHRWRDDAYRYIEQSRGPHWGRHSLRPYL